LSGRRPKEKKQVKKNKISVDPVWKVPFLSSRGIVKLKVFIRHWGGLTILLRGLKPWKRKQAHTGGTGVFDFLSVGTSGEKPKKNGSGPGMQGD